MGEDPQVVEQQIARTRERMSERTDALAYKADVKSRAKDAVAAKRDAVRDRVQGALGGARDMTQGALGGAQDMTPDGDVVRARARQGAGFVRDNPLGLALGAAAVGALIGLVLPRTAIEDERLGETADTLKAKIAETAQDAAGRGQQVAQDAMQAAKESGRQQAGELGQGVQDRAKEVGESATST